MKKKPEIMSPAGYWPQLRAAVEAGADAVYFGLKHFTARAKTGFDIEEVPEAMCALHERGVRGYLTFNTLIFERELEAAARTIAAVAKAGVDALIVQDVGALKIARETVPSMELHASTQMSITDADGVRFARSLGVSRVTLARELSLEEIRRIRRESDCELEMFVHGALCVAYSGQCLSSEAWGGRSANRGQCAQACRLPYGMVVDGEPRPLGDSRYLLSPGDLYTLEQVSEIVEAGVGALKIEGRYKDAEYVALTTDAYRRAVDAVCAGNTWRVAAEDARRLEQIYSRGLGPFFVNGTNHQSVVHGRAPRHRGLCMGKVVAVNGDSVLVQPGKYPFKPGDGLVFDAADWRSPEEPEEGGRVYSAEQKRGGHVELRFANNALRMDRIRPGDLVWRSHDPAVEAAAKQFTQPSAPVYRQALAVRVTARPGSVLKTDWWIVGRPEFVVSVYSEKELAFGRNRALDPETIRLQLGRLGNTPYVLTDVELDMEDSAFAPASLLNDLRRQAVAKLRELRISIPAPEIREWIPAPGPVGSATTTAPQLHVLVRTAEQLDAALELRPASITLDYLDLYGLRPSVEWVKASGTAVRVASPRILKPGESRIVDFLVSLNCEILVRASGILNALREKAPRTLTGDFSLNAANSAAAREYLGMGLARLTPAHDLNAIQIADFARRTGPEFIEAVIYQHLPVFHTEHCVFCRFLSKGTSYRDCGRPCEKHQLALTDPAGRAHPVMADVGCRNTIFGAEAQEASPWLEAWLGAGIRHLRLEFAHESGREVSQVVQAFERALEGGLPWPALTRELRDITPGGTTSGSLFVPVRSQIPIIQ